MGVVFPIRAHPTKLSKQKIVDCSGREEIIIQKA